MDTLTLQFLGAAGSVTGSRHLLSIGEHNLLVDCGLFQGRKELRLRNWEPFPIPPPTLNAVALTHAHLDHTGFLPRLVKEGFHGPIYCSQPTADLLGVLLPDSGHLQEEEAAFAARRGYSKHKQPLPLYTAEDAEDTLRYLHPFEHDQPVNLENGFQFRFTSSGHILGSKCLEISAAGLKILFTGDLGRYRATGGHPDAIPEPVDYLVMESTYGDRLHPKEDLKARLTEVIQQTVKQGGVVVIPAFAVERTQRLLFLLRTLIDEGRLPLIPIHLDSPMAIEAVKVFMRYNDEFDEETKAMVQRHGSPFHWPEVYFDKTVEQSKHAGALRTPAIIISSSGMATGGRVLHHLAQRLPDHHNTVIFVGFQAAETRGHRILSGATSVRIFGQDVPVRARIEAFEEFSDHADYEELLRWLSSFRQPPREVLLVHGEPHAAEALEKRIEEKFGWDVHVPQYRETMALH